MDKDSNKTLISDLTAAFTKAVLPENMSFDDLLINPTRELESGESALNHILRKDMLTPEGIHYLYDHGIDIHTIGPRGAMPMFDAICGDQNEVFHALMDCGGIAYVNSVQTVRADKKSLLHAAIMRGHIDIVERLITAGADINHIDAEDMTALSRAASTCDEDMVRLLLKSGADVVKYESLTGKKLLHVMHPMTKASATHGPEDRIVTMLINHGAQPDAMNAHAVPLVAHYAERNRNDIIAALISAGANLDLHGSGTSHLTPLCHAIAHDNFEMVAMLLNAGADANAATPYSDLPLMYALKKGDIAMCDLLIAGGADVNAIRQNGLSLLCQTVLSNLGLDSVEYLLNKGANPNMISFSVDGRARPLHIAANQQRMDCIELLLEHGANPLLPDLNGVLALEYAMKRLGPGNAVTERLRIASTDASQGRDTTNKKPKPDTGGAFAP